MGSPPAWAEKSTVGYCEHCGKKSYPSRRAARHATRRLSNRGGLRAYRCETNQRVWHFGHLPQAAAYGLQSAHEVYGRWPA